MNSELISIEIKPFSNNTEVLSLADFLDENGIKCTLRQEEMGVIKQCALDFLVAIFTSPEFWAKVATGTISKVIIEQFKFLICKINKGTQSNQHFNSMKIVSDGVEFVVENENISDEIISKGLDTFKDIAIANGEKQLSFREKAINKTVVFPNAETGEIEISSEIEYIKNHVVNKKDIEG